MPTDDEWTDAQDRATVTVDGHEVEVACYEKGSGEPVLFLHDTPTNSLLWRDVIGPIAEEGRTIVPDIIGSMYDGSDRSLRTQEQAFVEMLEHLGIDRFSLVGHDLGGGVLLRYIVHHPEEVEKPVLSNSVAYDSWPIDAVTERGLLETARENDVEDLQWSLDGASDRRCQAKRATISC